MVGRGTVGCGPRRAGSALSRAVRCAAIAGVGALLGGRGAADPPATASTRPVVLPDCEWSARESSWLDAEEDGVRSDGEPLIVGVQFAVADTVIGHTDVARGTSDAGGRARLTVALPGCLRAAFVVAARPPTGYHLTTPDSREAADGATTNAARGALVDLDACGRSRRETSPPKRPVPPGTAPTGRLPRGDAPARRPPSVLLDRPGSAAIPTRDADAREMARTTQSP